MSTTKRDPKVTPDPEALQPAPEAPFVINLDQHRVTYDTAYLTAFLDDVFRELAPGEHVLTWSARNRPGYPVDRAALVKKLGRTSAPRSLYYGTSTCMPDDDGQLRNRGALFKRLFVVVLDDIGTKVPLETLPEALTQATYVIETSPGNFQYGYVLDEPIDNFDHAKALVQLIYDSGFTDSGGALPCKLVRLPGGCNLKPAHAGFEVTMRKLTDRLWTPQELLTAAQCPTPWDEVVADATKALRRPQARSVTPWSSAALTSPNLDGGVDTVLEWLYAEDYVLQETDEWVMIRCPNAHAHTTGDDTAGYSPLGRGNGKFAKMRGFSCFHEHCSTYNAHEFLSWVAISGGPEEAVWDETSQLLREWVFDPVDNVARRVYGQAFSNGIQIPALRTLHPEKVIVHTSEGTTKKIPIATHWLQSPARVVVDGVTSDPSSDDRLVYLDDDSFPRVNIFRRQVWGEGEIFEDDIETFLDFLRYLVPTDEEREFFLDWLATKVTTPAFRGPAILMIASAFGTGRGTLADIVSKLLGAHNVTSLSFDRMTSGERFNKWMRSVLVTCNETLENQNPKDYYRVYERLKGLIETQPTTAYIDSKNTQERVETVYTSYLLFSNHEHAMAIPKDDRRIYVITNPDVPADKDYFAELYRWKDEVDPATGQAAWGPSVARWLHARAATVDVAQLLSRPPVTSGKARMHDAAASPLDRVIDVIVAIWRGRFIALSPVLTIIHLLGSRLNVHDHPNLPAMVRRSLYRHCVTIHPKYRVRLVTSGIQVRPRMLRSEITIATIRKFKERSDGMSAAAMAREIEQNDPDTLLAQLRDELGLLDL